MLLDKDDDLQHHLRPETNAYYVAASATAMQHNTDLLHGCKLLQALFSILPDTISLSSGVCFSNNAEDAA